MNECRSSTSDNDVLFGVRSFFLMEPQIREEKTPVVTADPPPPLSALPGGFLKQLVRDSEKEAKQKEVEVEVKEEKLVSRIRVAFSIRARNLCISQTAPLRADPTAAEQTERRPRAAVPPPRFDPSDPRG